MESALSWAAALAEGQTRLQRPARLGALPVLDYARAPRAPDSEQAVARALKKTSQRIWDRRPIVETVILRL